MNSKATTQPESSSMVDLLKTFEKQDNTYIEFLQNYIIRLQDNAPKFWTSLDLDVAAMDSKNPAEKAKIRKCLDLSEELRATAQLPPYRTFFMQNSRNEIIFCLKLTEPPVKGSQQD